MVNLCRERLLHFRNDNRQIIFGREAAAFGVEMFDHSSEDGFAAEVSAFFDFLTPLLAVEGLVLGEGDLDAVAEDDQAVANFECGRADAEGFAFKNAQQASFSLDRLG